MDSSPDGLVFRISSEDFEPIPDNIPKKKKFVSKLCSKMSFMFRKKNYFKLDF